MLKRLVIAAVLLGALPAAAMDARITLGADLWHHRYYNHYDGLLSGTLALGGAVSREVSLGGRAGVLLVTSPVIVGIPADFYVRYVPIPRLYIDGLVGPWFFLDESVFRLHVGGGFGYRGDGIQIGIEAAYLEPSALLGVRLGIPL